MQRQGKREGSTDNESTVAAQGVIVEKRKTGGTLEADSGLRMRVGGPGKSIVRTPRTGQRK